MGKLKHLWWHLSGWVACLVVTAKVTATHNGEPCEVDYISKITKGVVGCWAYGYYDPEYPYYPEAGLCKPKL